MLRNSRRTALITAAILLIYAIVSLVSVSRQLSEATELNARLTAETASVKAQNDALAYELENARTNEAIADAARHILRLTASDERIFLFDEEIRG